MIILTNKDKLDVQAAEIKLLIEVKMCTRLEHIKNAEIREELVVYSRQSKINKNKKNWYQYTERWMKIAC